MGAPVCGAPEPVLRIASVIARSPPPCAPAAPRTQTPEPPSDRPKLQKALALIDEANSEDPSRINVDGESVPYRCVARVRASGFVRRQRWCLCLLTT